MVYFEPSLTVTFTWLSSSKRWRVDYRYPTPNGRAVKSGFRLVDSDAPMDQVNVARLVDQLVAEMTSWISW